MPFRRPLHHHRAEDRSVLVDVPAAYGCDASAPQIVPTAEAYGDLSNTASRLPEITLGPPPELLSAHSNPSAGHVPKVVVRVVQPMHLQETTMTSLHRTRFPRKPLHSVQDLLIESIVCVVADERAGGSF